MAAVFVVCLALIIIGQRHIGAAGLVKELAGLAGLLALLYSYNRRYQ